MTRERSERQPSMSQRKRDEDNRRVALRLDEILEAKDARGKPKFSDLEVRDFLMACVFELGLPLTPELEPVMLRFLAELNIAAATPTVDDVLGGVRVYFKARPLNAELARAFQEFGASELWRGREGFQNDGARLNAALASAGLAATRRAPRMEEMATPKAAPKLRRGLM